MSDRDHLIHRLEIAFRIFGRQFRHQFLKSINTEISSGEFFVLNQLVQDGPLKVSDLAQTFDVSLSHITALSDKLVSKGLVERKRSEEDRRIVLLSVTEKGQEAMAHFYELKKEYLKKVFETVEEGELETVLRVFEKVQHSISQNG
ncbi:MarR family transcriptional regulator [Microaerobacter geothermalis]|uniref:MarR family winged helix-turn-helix transcriptional regulator n=1 Tax=Microaerobacter geothermalis TaxID=674972 RepID=UPI001F280355|nr:MarR family transcriptional regulator [Microaerobacter geothermalis]MCF6093591.1 MarR family transcriptional regulator [Microaerobacter geothermalis]